MSPSVKHVVFLDRATLQADLPVPSVPHSWTNHSSTEPEEVVPRCRDVQVVVSNKVRLTAGMLERLPRLELVAVPATGMDHVDREACAKRGVEVINCPDYSALSVPEHAIALMMALRRNLMGYWQDVADGEWARAAAFYAELHPVADLHGGTFGLVGSGSLGARTAQLVEALGMKVLKAERRGSAIARPGYTLFEDVLRQSDVLSLHCPLTPDNHGLIGTAELRAMKPSALLINTARGALVDEAALLTALDQGWIAGAGLDVLAHEPPPPDHPLLARRRGNLIVTPHVAWRTPLAMQRLARQLVERIERHLAAQSHLESNLHVQTH